MNIIGDFINCEPWSSSSFSSPTNSPFIVYVLNNLFLEIYTVTQGNGDEDKNTLSAYISSSSSISSSFSKILLLLFCSVFI